MTSDRWMPWVVAAVALLLFATGFNNPMFSMDDQSNTINHPVVRNFSLLALGQFNLGLYTPLTWTGYALAYQFGEDNAFWYHLFSGMLHAVNAYLVFRLFLRLSGHTTAAFLVALYFAVHPLQVEAVSWIAAFSTPLSGTFSLLAMLTYIKSTEKPAWNKHYWYALVFFVMACLAKPAALVIPIVLFVLDRYLNRPPFSQQSLLEKAGFFILAAGLAFVSYSAYQTGTSVSVGTAATFSPVDHLLMFSHSLAFFWTKTLVPLGLSLWYPFEKTAAGTWPWTYYAAPLMVLLVFGLAWRWRKSVPFLLSGLLFYLANAAVLLPAQILDGIEPRTDRYHYLAILGIFSILATLPAYFKEQRPRLAERLWVWLFLLGLGWLLISVSRIRDWRDSIVMLNNSIEHQGSYKGKAYLWRGMAHSDKKGVQAALEDFSKALNADSTLMDAYKFRGALLGFIKQYERSLADLNKYLETNPDNPEMRYNRGLTLVNLSKYEEALEDFNRTLELNPDFERAYRARGNVRIQLGDQKGGDEDLKEWERRSGLPGK